LSALGLGALLMASATLFQIIRWLAYLIFIGLKMLVSKKDSQEVDERVIGSQVR
jgi:threonine/homoserine/homoserine lactone efflux protein